LTLEHDSVGKIVDDILIDSEKHYPHLRAKLQTEAMENREAQHYFRNQSNVGAMNSRINVSRNLILQRVMGHPEIVEMNNKWVHHHECYVCDRWAHTLFVMQPGTYPVIKPDTTGLPEDNPFV